jgi:hypothetical protein
MQGLSVQIFLLSEGRVGSYVVAPFGFKRRMSQLTMISEKKKLFFGSSLGFGRRLGSTTPRRNWNSTLTSGRDKKRRAPLIFAPQS